MMTVTTPHFDFQQLRDFVAANEHLLRGRSVATGSVVLTVPDQALDEHPAVVTAELIAAQIVEDLTSIMALTDDGMLRRTHSCTATMSLPRWGRQGALKQRRFLREVNHLLSGLDHCYSIRQQGAYTVMMNFSAGSPLMNSMVTDRLSERYDIPVFRNDTRMFIRIV